MNAKKCDRCGKYYTDGSFACYSGGSMTIVSSTGRKVINKNTEYDLCEECAEGFEKWMKQDNSVVCVEKWKG